MPDRPLRDALAHRVRDVLSAHGDVREVAMFGGLSFMVDGRMAVAAGPEGELLVRTDPAENDDLLRRGAQPAYMGDARPMGAGWLTVPASRIRDDAELAFWVGVGIRSGRAAR